MPNINADGRFNAEFNHPPDVCPQCHHALEPKLLQATLSGEHDKHGTNLEIAFKCTHRNCGRMFIGQYERNQVQRNSGNMVGIFNFKRAVPLKYVEADVFEEVEEISPSFKIIYTQAAAAESYGLSEIAGSGYRKALEFLIKDYCIHKSPKEKEQIANSFLGNVINDQVDDANLKACAQRAAWLGNDETHYTRKWKDKDISDLKVLINLTCVWVRSNVVTEKYLKDME